MNATWKPLTDLAAVLLLLWGQCVAFIFPHMCSSHGIHLACDPLFVWFHSNCKMKIAWQQNESSWCKTSSQKWSYVNQMNIHLSFHLDPCEASMIALQQQKSTMWKFKVPGLPFRRSGNCGVFHAVLVSNAVWRKRKINAMHVKCIPYFSLRNG